VVQQHLAGSAAQHENSNLTGRYSTDLATPSPQLWSDGRLHVDSSLLDSSARRASDSEEEDKCGSDRISASSGYRDHLH